jgi:hypothetical protein
LSNGHNACRFNNVGSFIGSSDFGEKRLTLLQYLKATTGRRGHVIANNFVRSVSGPR